MSIMIIIDKIPITGILDESLTQNNQYQHSRGLYYGGGGSYTKFIGEYGRKISFKSITPVYEKSINEENMPKFKDYQKLAKKASQNIVPLISTSHAEYNGVYILTKFDHSEDNNGNFETDWEFEEIKPYNITKERFKTLKPPKYKKIPPKKISFKKNASKNTRYLLTKCPTMKKGSKKKDCVKRLQRFLKNSGFYIKWKIDGLYGNYTQKSMLMVQKKGKIPVTGNWDNKTINFYENLYNLKPNTKIVKNKHAKKKLKK